MFFSYLIKNPQTTSALTFLTHIILAIDGVRRIRLEVQVWHSHQNWTSLHKLISDQKCLKILIPD